MEGCSLGQPSTLANQAKVFGVNSSECGGPAPLWSAGGPAPRCRKAFNSKGCDKSCRDQSGAGPPHSKELTARLLVRSGPQSCVESDIVCVECITITNGLIANAESTGGFTSISVKKLRLRRALKLKIRWRKKRGRALKTTIAESTLRFVRSDQ
jgi:hypothetical protein